MRVKKQIEKGLKNNIYIRPIITKINSMELKIFYNTFTYDVSFDFEEDLKQSIKNLIEEKRNKLRLSGYIENVLKTIIEEYNIDALRLTIHCSKFDKDDLQFAIDSYVKKNGKEIITNFIEDSKLNNAPRYLIDMVRNFKSKLPTEIAEELEKDKDFETLISNLTQEVEVVVTGTMSAGKSTLLNALIGREILPNANEATTATICRIKNNDKQSEFKAKVFKGNEVIEESKTVNIDFLRDKNNLGNEGSIEIELEGNIKNITSKDFGITLIDTPGPNNSKNSQHQKTRYEYLKDTKNKPVFLYMLDATAMGINDENDLIEEISKFLRENKSESDRIIFVLNKVDEFDQDKGELIENTIEDCKKYLKSHGIAYPIIFPVSSLYALLDKKENLSRKEAGRRSAFNTVFLPDGDYKGINLSSLSSLPKDLSEDLFEENKDQEVLVRSGILVINNLYTQIHTKQS